MRRSFLSDWEYTRRPPSSDASRRQLLLLQKWPLNRIQCTCSDPLANIFKSFQPNEKREHACGSLFLLQHVVH